MPDLKNKIACVTGGTKGIGRAIAEALLNEGASVAICARHENDVEDAVGAMRKLNRGKISGRACDVRNHQQVKAFINHTVERFGGLDILINNAGVGGFGSVQDLAPEQWRQTIETNLTGVYYCCHEAIPEMKKRGGGFIVNMGSLAGKNAFSGGAAYNASKFGLIGFSEALMLDVRYDNIRVSYIMPGSVNTEFNDDTVDASKAWQLTAEDVAHVVLNVLKLDPRAMASRVELRPSKPPKKS